MKLLAVMEASSVTGPAKNLIDFALRARELPEPRRIETAVVTFEREGRSGSNAFLDALRQAGIPARSVRQRSVADRRTLAGLRSAVEHFAPDLVQTHGVKSHFLMRLLGWGRRRPWVAFHHGYTTTDLKMRLYNQFDRWSLRAPAHIVTVSAAFERQLYARGVPAGRITVVHNAIEPEWMKGVGDAASLRASLGVRPEEQIVFTAGRLSAEKAQADLVAAMRNLRDLAPGIPARLIIAGEGPERGRIERIAQELGVAERVTLAGFIPDPRPYYALANVVALSSLTEGSPNTLLEAIAAGVPVVATAVGGIPEIVTHASAILVSPRQPAEMAAAIANVLADPLAARRRAEAARARIQACHSPSARVDRLVDLYARLVAET